MNLTTLPTTPRTPESCQPGGGLCMKTELLWGRFRRWRLRTTRPGYVRAMAEKKQGTCPNCSHDIVDPRDLKFVRNVCGHFFRPEDDPFRYRDHLGFARYGLAELLIFTILFVKILCITLTLTYYFHWSFWILAVAAIPVWLEVVYFFRDPERKPPDDPRAVISPADGTITNIEEVDEPEMGRVFRISIFLSIFNVHVNRVPWPGAVQQVRYFPGEFLDARNSQSAVRNEQLWIDLEANGRPMRIKQISGAIARRIVCWLKKGDVLVKGERMGMIKFGSRTDILIPADVVREVCVKVGDKVQGALTILWKW